MPPRHRIYIDCGEVASIRLARSLAGALNLPCLFLDVRNDRHTAQSVLRLVGRVNGSPRAVPEHRHNRRLPLRDLCQGDGSGISFRTRQGFARIHNSQPLRTASLITTPMQLLGMTHGLVIQQALYSVAKLGVADLLKDGPQTSSELARNLNVGRSAL
jgi:hypothetical protein